MLGSVVLACLAASCLAAPTVRMEAAILNEPHLPAALQRAQHVAGKAGFVASLPQLMWARSNAAFDNEIWNNWFTSQTEEVAFTTKSEDKYVIVVHGGGILSVPGRLEAVYQEDGSGMTQDGRSPEHGNDRSDESAAKLTVREAHDMLDGRLPDGTRIPIFTYQDFAKSPHLPQRYGVVLNADVANKSGNGYVAVQSLYNDPLFVTRAGGLKYAAAYLNKAAARHNTTKYGSWHPYGRIDFNQPQARIVFLSGNQGGQGSDGSGTKTGYGEDYGLGGDANIANRGRYVAVSTVNESATIRNADFGVDSTKGKLRANGIWMPHLSLALQEAQIAAGSKGFVAQMPEIMAARTRTPFENDIWHTRYTTTSEESIVEDEDGNLKVVTVHGGGIFSTPERILQAFNLDSMYHYMTGDYDAKLTEKEASRLLKGALPDGSSIPMYSFEDFQKGIHELPRRYGVITDFDIANTSVRGYNKFGQMRHDPMLLVHAGGKAQAEAYINRISQRQETLGNWNRYAALDKSRVPSAGILFIDYEGGVLGSNGLVNVGRYVAVAPENEHTSLRNLDFLVPYETDVVADLPLVV
eukprot:TRINITY_DN91157_c0_g1_i1.p1 TRINITY_DN91157_c0_g1~~TRINITY_DN91157_c0_g1_i1.p1  ORF type:complete len:581 (-),score=93.97 TRINITY_DN91157_c0_g1_i1:443-2185(-)